MALIVRWGLLSLLGLAAACNGADGGASARCREICENGCDAAQACGLETSGDKCADECVKSLGAADCSEATPLDRLTCEKLEHVFDCTEHCLALCKRAVDCATFDEQTCLTGCSVGHAEICNAASVPVRSCDDIKVEARDYEAAGKALQAGRGYSSFSSSGAAFGLCEQAEDCKEPLACSMKTNTCGECTMDAECARGGEPMACHEGACVAVECAVDDDCSGSLCDMGRHVCGRCESANDCAADGRKVCDTESSTCVECMQNSDCNPLFAPRCNLDTYSCAACESHADCDNGLLCNTSVGVCDQAP